MEGYLSAECQGEKSIHRGIGAATACGVIWAHATMRRTTVVHTGEIHVRSNAVARGG